MKAKIGLLVCAVLLSLTLVACGNNEPKENEINETVSLPEDIVDDKKGEVNAVDSYDLKISEEDFKTNYSKYVDQYNLGMKLPDSIPTEHDNGYVSTELFRAEDISIYISAKKGEMLNYILLESYGAESRQTTFKAIEAMILSVVDGVTEDDVANIMTELELTDPSEFGNVQENFTTYDQFGFTLSEDSRGSIEFGIIHKDDADLAPED